ncbi:polynucleotide kinase 3'-phosphatase [Helicocarpus griseus UAMH5409]|uniref:Polynucleotide kinase 3'-phosphatase n=1 Tax=Helicocarpus griseus UAMH5409 TaxID=1447875 RepID=A0A2B7X600_9EURO|nr:polynucleotide kinase 3'-phosphatase [Helicocarpus griseus UAMH5409]
MHELLVFASIPAKQHHDLLQQLSGLTAMQPTRTLERHLIFKAYRKPGFIKTRPGGSQDVQAPEVQRLNKLLNGGLYYTQVVGRVRERDFGSGPSSSSSGQDIAMQGSGDGGTTHPEASSSNKSNHDDGAATATTTTAGTGGAYVMANQTWRLEFKDTPDAGTRSAVTSRFVGSAKLGSGDVLPEMNAWGYNYVSEYVVEGHTFILDDTVLFLHRVLTFPSSPSSGGTATAEAPTPAENLPPLDKMVPLDMSGTYVLQASITVQDSGNPDMLKANSQRLLGLKEHLKSVVKLEPADRLSLDTRTHVRPSHLNKPLARYMMTGTKRSSPNGDISPPPLKRKALDPATSKSASNFFTPLSQKKPESVTWRVVDNSCIIAKYHPEEAAAAVKSGSKRRIAAFDLDSTLIATQSGKRFAANANDWKWWNSVVPGKVKELNDKGYLIVVLSNQKAISLKKEVKGGRVDSKSLSIFKQKVAAVMRSLDVPFSLYAATEYDQFRKPRMGMWREVVDDYDLDAEGMLDLEGSIFVGDAAGREGDHSCVDRDFAANVGIPFKTPEEFFLDEPPKLASRAFDPKTYILDTAEDEQKIAFAKKNDIELVIFCGSPGSGKSTYYWRYLKPLDYERVNQDILKSRPKCLKVAKEFLTAGKSVAVDNTNANPETRAHWVQLAKELNVPIRCINITTPPQICRHNDAVRANNTKIESINPESRTMLPGIAFGDFARRFREPTLSEGFQDIIQVEFKFQGPPAVKEVWGQYWV